MLAIEKPGYTRDAERRADLMRWLGEWKAVPDAELVPRLLPYLTDHDENVRFAVVDGLGLRDPALTGELWPGETDEPSALWTEAAE